MFDTHHVLAGVTKAIDSNHLMIRFLFSRAVPKKSATAKPIVSKSSSSSIASKKPSQISDNDSDSDFGDFSLPKLTAKAKQVSTGHVIIIHECRTGLTIFQTKHTANVFEGNGYYKSKK